jgi:hypothetical protein
MATITDPYVRSKQKRQNKRTDAQRQANTRYYEKQRELAQQAKAEQIDMFKPVKKSCNCHQYTTCMICRNTEKRRAFRAGELPVYRVPMIAAAIAATD